MYTDKHGEIKMTFLRTPHNYDMDETSVTDGLECKDATLAQQQFKEETDINTIVERFGLTGELPRDLRTPTNADVWQVQNLQEAMNVVTHARETFMQMPANVRSTFDNDPAKFIDFVSDEDNRVKAEKLGLVLPKKEEKNDKD